MNTIQIWAPELGRLCLTLAMLAGLMLALAPLLTRWLRREATQARFYSPLAAVQMSGCIAAFVCLQISLASDDFSVAYVQANSHKDLPLPYKLAALWGAHEGSLLLWLLLLGLWGMMAPSNTDKPLPSLSVISAIFSAFAAFTLLTSDPFARLLPLPPEVGADLNPLLQHPALAVHPPILYAGYTAMVVPFALALSNLSTPQKRFGQAQARLMRAWTLVPWALLTAGIALGSWWAYQELGWGGWWFWDPVENLSVLPWLCAAALAHALLIAEKRGTDYSWCLLLAVLGFPLAMLGAFIVRSGLLVSVHSFSSDPQRGIFLLLLLAAVSIPAVAMLWRIPASRTGARPLSSRDILLLACGALMTLALGIILLGTLYPLVYEAFTGERAAVGAPYFETVLLPLSLAMAMLMLLAPLSRWGAPLSPLRDLLTPAKRRLLLVGAGSALTGLLAPFAFTGTAGMAEPRVWVCALLSALLAAVLGSSLYPAFAAATTAGQSLRMHWRMALAHSGVMLIALGALWQGNLGIQREVLLSVGQSLQTPVGELVFEGISRIEGPNYRADRARFTLRGEELQLFPEKRLYSVRSQILSEAAIARVGLGDLYLNLGQVQEDGSWSLRVHYKPLIGLVWLGAAVVALGVLLIAGLMFVGIGRKRRPAQGDTAAAGPGREHV